MITALQGQAFYRPAVRTASPEEPAPAPVLPKRSGTACLTLTPAAALLAAQAQHPIYPLSVDIQGQKSEFKGDQIKFSVGPGQSFVMSVPEKRVNGYKWFADLDPATPGLAVSSEEFQLPPNSDGHVDQIGTHLFTMQLDPKPSATTRLSLSLRRSWDPHGPALQTKQIEVELKK